MAPHPIPYAQLETIFFDAGNTLVSFDLTLVQAELAARGLTADIDRLRRAEAAARPIVSAALTAEHSTEATSTFELYLREMLRRAHLLPPPDSAGLSALAHELVLALDAIGRVRLWSSVLPRVPETLTALRARGLQLAVVSNSDGTIEQLLTEQALRPFFTCVVDSHVIGHHKPDPRIFQHALRMTDAAPDTTLHVGDLYDSDIVGARAAGVHALLLDPFGDWPDVDCERAPDIAALLDRLPAA